jgi:hypothetical protein
VLVGDDITIEILTGIRAEIRESNVRLTRIEVEHGQALLLISATLERIANHLWSDGGLEHRVEKCEREIEKLKRRKD